LVRTLAGLRREQLSVRYGERNYDPSIAGLGTHEAQRRFASDFELLSLVRRYRDRSGRGRGRQRPTARYCTGPASTAMQYWIEKKLTWTNYMKLPELFQPVEKKAKCFRSIAPIICRSRKRLDERTRAEKLVKTTC
jgi:hypothetical protein